jgi:hypothetical protein
VKLAPWRKKRRGKTWLAQGRKNTENKIMNENNQNQNVGTPRPATTVDAVSHPPSAFSHPVSAVSHHPGARQNQ